MNTEDLGDIYHRVMEEEQENIVRPEDFKIHASKSSNIMGIKALGKTGEGFIEEWYLSKKYNRKKDFYSQFVEKGLITEDIGIAMLSRKLGVELYKNDEYFSDDEMIGTPDINLPIEILDSIWDIKQSWSLFTFPYFDTELPNKDYFYQLQVYMALTGKTKAGIAYCLVDTPKPLVMQELKKLYYASGGVAEDWTPETYEHLYPNYRFDDIPESKRIKIFEVKRDEVVIQKIRDRVVEARAYLTSILK